ncbi:MAG TPA: polysaccharide pyruvyl transferase family protein [Acidimicrobiales bacterium]|nr:polysaccharide pyruvyl transferase family protein [Acidimicrobiales bacterium]
MATAALLFNFKSVNLGNEALTAQVGREMRDAYGAANVSGFHRLPGALNIRLCAGTPAAFEQEADKWATRVAGLPPRAAGGGFDVMEFGLRHESLLGGPGSPRRNLVSVVTGLPVVRSLRASRQSGEVERQLHGVVSHDHVAYMPAGEINTVGAPLTRFLEIAVAQRTGRRTALVNFSYEPNAAVTGVARAVLPACDLIFVRDERSIPRLVGDGASLERIRVVPDAVIAVDAPRRDPVRETQRVGIAFNSTLDSANLPVWSAAIKSLRAQGREVVLLSNEQGRDERSLASVARETGTEMLEAPRSYVDYAKELTRLDAVVSTRFHTLVLALVCGLRAIPVEGTADRIRGALEVFGLPGVVVDARPAAGDFDTAIVNAVVDGGCGLTVEQVDGLAQQVRSSYASLPSALAS